jgi:hypothetical protein
MSSVAISAMTCEALKQMCRERGLKVSGKKDELVSRIEAFDSPLAAAEEEVEESAESDSCEMGDASAMKAKLQAMPLADVMKIAKAAMAELERRAKSGAPKAAKAGGAAAAAPKKNSVAEWQQFVLNYSLENGWPTFEYKANRKLNGVMTPVTIEMPASELVDGAYIVPGSVSKKSPAGVQLSISQAMCLAKKYWSSKENSGERADIWAAFQETQPQEKIVAVSPSRPKMTLAALQQTQLAAEAAAKAVIEATKAKALAAKPVAKSAKPLVKKAAAAAAKWSCPNDGLMHEFSHGGVQYRRNFDGYIFGMDEDATYLGKWDEAKSCLDDTVANPFE